jgi:hypothetical protein
MKRNRIREPKNDPTHGVVVHPGIMYLSEVAAAVKRGKAAVNAAILQNNPYLLGLTVEEGREVAKILEVLRGRT